jgi:hypothetical protein
VSTASLVGSHVVDKHASHDVHRLRQPAIASRTPGPDAADTYEDSVEAGNDASSLERRRRRPQYEICVIAGHLSANVGQVT